MGKTLSGVFKWILPTLIFDPRKGFYRKWTWGKPVVTSPLLVVSTCKSECRSWASGCFDEKLMPYCGFKKFVPTLIHSLLLEDAEEGNGFVTQTLKFLHTIIREILFSLRFNKLDTLEDNACLLFVLGSLTLRTHKHDQSSVPDKTEKKQKEKGWQVSRQEERKMGRKDGRVRLEREKNGKRGHIKIMQGQCSN